MKWKLQFCLFLLGLAVSLGAIACVGGAQGSEAECEESEEREEHEEEDEEYEECEDASGAGGTPAAGEPARPTPTAVISTAPDGSTQVMIFMQSPTGNHQTGYATLRSNGDKTEVLVSVRPPQPSAQPMQIHAGECSAQLGPVISVLQDVVNGESLTVLDKPLREVAGAAQVINVHRSASDISTSTACGVIPPLS